MMARVFDGQAERVSRDDIPDNITLYWLTNTAVSSSRLYWENRFAVFAPKGVTIPVAVSAFPTELYTCPRSSSRCGPRRLRWTGGATTTLPALQGSWPVLKGRPATSDLPIATNQYQRPMETVIAEWLHFAGASHAKIFSRRYGTAQ